MVLRTQFVVVVAQSLSHVRFLTTPWTVAHQALCPWDSPGKNTGVGCPSPHSEDLLDPGNESTFPALQTDSLPLSHWGSLQNILTGIYNIDNTDNGDGESSSNQFNLRSYKPDLSHQEINI